MNAAKKILSLTLALLTALLPLGALAETQTPPNQITLALTNVSIPSLNIAPDAGVALRLTLGADENARVLSEGSLTVRGEEAASFAAAFEDSRFKATVSPLEEGISLPETDAVPWLTRALYPRMEDIDPLWTAAGQLADLLKTGLTFAPLDRNAFLISEDTWRAYWESHLERPNLVHEGEAEITLFDRTYTAQKYTYDSGRMHWQDYLAESLPRANDLLLANVDMRLTEAAQAVAKAATQEPEPYRSVADNEYTRLGTIYLIEEVMGVVEESTLIAHTPDGDETHTFAYADMFTDGGARIETRSYDPTVKTTVEETFLLTPTADGAEYLHTVDTYSAETVAPREGSIFVEISSARHSLCFDENSMSVGSVTTSQASGGHTSDEGFLVELHAGPETAGQAAGTLSLHKKNGDTDWSFSANLAAEFSRLPDGELLALPNETIDPVHSPYEARDKADSAVYLFFVKVISSLTSPSDVIGSFLNQFGR